MSNISSFKKWMKPGSWGHLIGIGGVSMAPLAEVLMDMGLIISGSDINKSESVDRLNSLGAKVSIGHDEANLDAKTEFVVRTAAVHNDNPEIIAARRRGIPVYERTEAWGAIMGGYENALCIAGTHGKTTTTSMCTHIMMAAHRDPTAMIGGTLPLLSASHRVGSGDTIIMESCEYTNSFHHFTPTIAVVLNIEADHLDFFKDLEDVKDSFRHFASLVPEDGIIIANLDDDNTMDALLPLERELLTFGLSAEADVRAENIIFKGASSSFDVYCQDEFFTEIVLTVPGLHNIKNALAACAAAICLDIEPDAVSRGLRDFHGAGRRFEYKGEYNGAVVYDDYAHHPGELCALMDAVEIMDYKRIIIAFQPHTYSRTNALLNDFIEQLRRPHLALLAEIYAAREQNTVGISSADLCAKIPGSEFYAGLGELKQRLCELAAPGDIILTVGAGDIYKVGEAIV
jgi:UDP-N-acetylmuramate--alanine ligase